MTVDPLLVRQIKRDEGGPFLSAYPDALSPLAKWATQYSRPWTEGPTNLSGAPWTWAWGHTGPEVYRGYTGTLALAESTLLNDLATHNLLLSLVLPWTVTLDPPRLRVLQNMIYNLGWDNPKTPAHEGLSGFTTFLGLVQRGSFGQAANDLATTLWARQVKTRAVRLEQQLRTGVDVL